MTNNKIQRTTICWPLDDVTTLQTLDQARGNLSRSAAVQRCLEYLCSQGTDLVKGIIKDRHKPQEQNPNTNEEQTQN